MAVSKIEYFGEVLIDLTNDTVSADKILAGYTAHGKDGEPITGTLEVEDVTEETAAYTTKLGTQDTIIEQIVTALQNKTAAEVKEEQEKTVTPTSSIQEVIPDDGKTLSKVTVNAVPTEDKTITPSKSTQTITPTSGKFLSQVTVNGDSDLVAANIKKSINIFGVTGTYEGDTSIEDGLITRSLTTYTNSRVTSIATCAFYSWRTLQKADFSNLSKINTYAFTNCSAMTALILRKTSRCNLSSTNALQGSSVASGTGYIYVPRSLVSSYKTATNWSTYANQFRAIEDYPDITGG